MKLLRATILIAAASITLWGAADPSAEPPSPVPPAEIVDHYVKAVQAEQAQPQPVSMDVEMDASLPRLKKQGRFQALRFITRLGQIFYQKQQFQGDSTIKKEVIARYLQAEKDARNNTAGSIGVTPENYKFKYKGTTDYSGRTAYVFQVNPKKKRVGLYKGELWIDRETYLPLREWGEFVKSPSVFLRSVYFVRDYMIYNGISVPRRVISDVNTRVVGRAQLTIWYENVKIGDTQGVAAGGDTNPAVAAAAQAGPGGGH